MPEILAIRILVPKIVYHSIGRSSTFWLLKNIGGNLCIIKEVEITGNCKNRKTGYFLDLYPFMIKRFNFNRIWPTKPIYMNSLILIAWIILIELFPCWKLPYFQAAKYYYTTWAIWYGSYDVSHRCWESLTRNVVIDKSASEKSHQESSFPRFWRSNYTESKLNSFLGWSRRSTKRGWKGKLSN